MANITRGLDADIAVSENNIEERVRRAGEMARIMTDAGLIFITTIDNADDYDLEALKMLNEPNEIMVINVGINELMRYKVDMEIKANEDTALAVQKVVELLRTKEIILEYYL